MDKKSNNKIPFGLKDGVMVEVAEVASGLACKCICPACKGKLQANKGTKKSHYFSHDPLSNTEECRSAFETSIHSMAKQILEENKYTMLPLLELTMSMEDDIGITHWEKLEVTAKGRKNFTNVELEKRVGDIRPDIVAYTSSQLPFLVEIAVTNFSNNEKKKKIRGLGLFAIEIDLSKISYSVSKQELTKSIVEEFNNKKWLSNPDAIGAKIELCEKLKKKVDAANEKLKLKRQNQSQKPHIKSIKSLYDSFHKRSNTKPTKTSDRRYFRCGACKYIFDKSILEAPYNLKNIECPECGRFVSTAK